MLDTYGTRPISWYDQAPDRLWEEMDEIDDPPLIESSCAESVTLLENLEDELCHTSLK